MSDHFSGPAVMGDPSVDLTDFYAFPSLERPGNLALIMDVFPLASPQSVFSDAIVYRFRLRPLSLSDGKVEPGVAEHTIDVSFDNLSDDGTTAKRATVAGICDALPVSLSVGESSEQQGIRAFAGLVSDPFFMDVDAMLRTDTSGTLSFSRPGFNTVHGRDVLSIVVEVPVAPSTSRASTRTWQLSIVSTVTPPGDSTRTAGTRFGTSSSRTS